MILSKANITALAILSVFATALAPAMGADQRNLLVIGMSFLVPLLLFAFRMPLPPDTWWVTALASYMVVITLTRGFASDLSTVFYTTLLAVSYIGLVSSLRTGMVERQAVIGFLRYLILAFAIVSVAQMVTSIAGLPQPNLILSKGMWSYNSLSAEPSHLGRVLPISILVYILLLRFSTQAQFSPLLFLWRERVVVLAFLIAILLSGSALATMAAPLALLLALPFRWSVAPVAGLILAMPFLIESDLPALERGLLFLSALPTLDLQELADADHSAYVRVAPTLIYLKSMTSTSTDFIFGSGVSSIRPTFEGEVIGVADSIGAGFFPGYVIAFGLVGTLLMTWIFLLRFLHNSTLPIIVMWTLLFLTSGWNTQLFWYGLMLIRVVHHFSLKSQKVDTVLSNKPTAWPQRHNQLA